MNEQMYEQRAAAYLSELRSLAGSDLLHGCWLLSPAAAWAQLGWPQLQDPLLRRQLDWYGPIEDWRDPLQRIDEIQLDRIDGGDVSVALVQAGRRQVTGMRLQRDWLHWLVEQRALRSGAAAPSAPVDGLRSDVVLGDDGTPLSLTIVPLAADRPRLRELVRSGALAAVAAELLPAQLTAGGSLLIAGAHAAGKSLLIAAVTAEVRPDRQIVVLGDRPERRLGDDALCWPWPAAAAQQALRLSQLLRRSGALAVIDEGQALAAAPFWQAVVAGLPFVASVTAPSIARALTVIEQRCAATAADGRTVRALLSAAYDGLLVVELGTPREGCINVMRSGTVLRTAAAQPGDPYTLELRSARPEAADAGRPAVAVAAVTEEARWSW